MIYLVTLGCVLGIATGQILFKIGAMALVKSDSVWALKPFFVLLMAMGLYGITSGLWVWVLQRVELGRVYPFMALAFIFVPVASHMVFGEKFASQYWFGIALIVLGIVITTNSPKI